MLWLLRGSGERIFSSFCAVLIIDVICLYREPLFKPVLMQLLLFYLIKASIALVGRPSLPQALRA
jgi:hypothetical protein